MVAEQDCGRKIRKYCFSEMHSMAKDKHILKSKKKKCYRGIVSGPSNSMLGEAFPVSYAKYAVCPLQRICDLYLLH